MKKIYKVIQGTAIDVEEKLNALENSKRMSQSIFVVGTTATNQSSYGVTVVVEILETN